MLRANATGEFRFPKSPAREADGELRRELVRENEREVVLLEGPLVDRSGSGGLGPRQTAR